MVSCVGMEDHQAMGKTDRKIEVSDMKLRIDALAAENTNLKTEIQALQERAGLAETRMVQANVSAENACVSLRQELRTADRMNNLLLNVIDRILITSDPKDYH
jgi:regulator of replication initiation timing